ncbi:alpha/beta fold hydrolase [Aliidiomarina haloalkalitolerans]|uniref:Alpha/beta hydrolase n=1 Tax=Aliidiomarina haloalkalitolerans TaxID=859059 RepID=A0A432VXK6_9GAMM|nr:alpha/beta hydrolase [Aliidiomarina haloalkalitolerans]RUO21328.1 alpha/beta hydrolase [Aliidiomarina haloalkalitolerans]
MNIVALHSSQSHSGQWKNLHKALLVEGLLAGSETADAGTTTASMVSKSTAQVHEFFAPDLIGYGRGAPVSKEAVDFRLADELAALTADSSQLPFAARPGQEPVVLVGHSYGGALALQWALRYPEQVRGLVLYEPVSFHVLPADSPARAEIVAIAEQMDNLSLAEAAASFVDYWNTPGYFARLPERARSQMVTQQAKVQADFHALLDEATELADYAALRMPVVLVHGTESPLSSQTVAQCLAATIPHCLHLDVAAGHMAPLTQATVVNPLLVNGLRYVLQASASPESTHSVQQSAAVDG